MKKIKLAFLIILAVSAVLSTSCAVKPEEKTLEQRAGEIHQRVLTIDTHIDTPILLLGSEWKIGEGHNPGGRRGSKVDLPRMAEGGLDAAFFAVFTGQGERTEQGYLRAKEYADRLLDAIHKMAEDYPHLVEVATNPEDAYRLEKQGKRAAFIGMENGYPIGKELSLLKDYYRKGVRYLTLCHGQDNDICDSSTDRRNPEDNGLSDFGREVVAECNRLGIMVDVSHISDKSFYDVLKVSKAPVVATHSCVRSLCDESRNLSDEMITALSFRGGVIQIAFVSSFLMKEKPNPERDKAVQALREKYGSRRDIKDEAVLNEMREEYTAIYEKYPVERARVKDLVDHIDYVVRLVGIDFVGIGTDHDGGGDLEDCEDVSQLPRITEELVRRGYSEKDIRKIWGGNFFRVFRDVIEASGKQ